MDTVSIGFNIIISENRVQGIVFLCLTDEEDYEYREDSLQSFIDHESESLARRSFFAYILFCSLPSLFLSLLLTF